MRRSRSPGGPEVWPHTWAGERLPRAEWGGRGRSTCACLGCGCVTWRYCCVPVSNGGFAAARVGLALKREAWSGRRSLKMLSVFYLVQYMETLRI